jgi:hypothetical protein
LDLLLWLIRRDEVDIYDIPPDEARDPTKDALGGVGTVFASEGPTFTAGLEVNTPCADQSATARLAEDGVF